MVQTGNNAPPQMCDFIITVPDPGDHAHVTFSFRRNETRQPNMRQDHLWPISAQSWEGKGQHPRGPLLSRQAVIRTGIRDARAALRCQLPCRLCLWPHTYNIRPLFSCLFFLTVDPFWISLFGRGFSLDHHMSALQVGGLSLPRFWEFQSFVHSPSPLSTLQDLNPV